MPQEPLQLLNRRPYLFLKFFELLDTEVFFGRETESLLLWRKILSYRLVVLVGASGAGKSSLLNAGVWPKLTPYHYDVCGVRVGGDPAAAVRKEAYAVLRPQKPAEGGQIRETLASFFQRAMTPDQRLVVFIDQFEELFVNLAPDLQKRFLSDLAHCVRDLPREVRFVLALREDFLPQLEAHRDLLLQYDANSFRLEALGRAAAELAITEPARRVGLAYEPALVRALLDDLAEGGCVPPPQLQIVCDRLYDRAVGTAQRTTAQALTEQTNAIFPMGKSAQEVRATITREQYQALGGARKILADYVDERIGALPEVRRDLGQGHPEGHGRRRGDPGRAGRGRHRGAFPRRGRRCGGSVRQPGAGSSGAPVAREAKHALRIGPRAPDRQDPQLGRRPGRTPSSHASCWTATRPL